LGVPIVNKFDAIGVKETLSCFKKVETMLPLICNVVFTNYNTFVNLLIMRFDGFDWDEGNAEKITKHGLSLSLVEWFFYRDVWVTPDTKHSTKEERHIAHWPIP
jgi:hypothetical protein